MHSPIVHHFTPRALKANEKAEYIRPFLRWVGGKQRLVACLKGLMPLEHPKRYFEPFLGGGSLFFAHRFAHAELSDLNPHLINAYEFVRDAPNDMHRLLTRHAIELEAHGKPYYLEQRELFNEQDLAPTHLEDQAARFIFLNRSNFNGMYRVNRSGRYNVPFGSTDKPYLPGLSHLLEVSARLKDAHIAHHGYDTIRELVGPGDMVYLDPPYPVLSPTANFTGYTMKPFSEIEQRMLAENAKTMVARGARVMISNAKVDLIEELYPSAQWEHHVTRLKRNVSAKRPALEVEELVLISRVP
jgi:DNA adenine methylase